MATPMTTDGLRRLFNVRVSMRDAVELSVDVTFPTTTPAPAVVVVTPYGKSSQRAADVAAAYAHGGYVFVAADVRGRGDSDGGPFVPYRRDGRDGADLVAWIAAQEWCTGEVATWGGSYAGRVQWLIALEQPPALKAMVVQVCPSDPHVEWPTGIQTLMHIHWHAATDGRASQVRPHVDWEAVLRHLPLVDLDEAAGFRSETWREELGHQTTDAYWEEISYQQRMHELDMMKIKFFTNVSHEFKTPLSLILSPIEKILKTSYEPEQKKQFQLIHRNAKRLLHLVNQLLDFRRMEVEELTLNSSKGDVAMFIKDVCCSFTDLAERKHIKFFYTSYVDHLLTNFDHDKIERILFNLLSNAFKFTPQNGSVSVEINMNRRNENVLLEIIVKDTGIGIPKDKKEKIFERFFQTEIPGSLINQGSGIGLAITKEFVKMHNGSISVESEIDRGSCFTVLIPFAEINEEINDTDVSSLKYSDMASSSVEEKEPQQQPSNKTDVSKEKKQIILIVEDNEDFRFYLKDNLKMFYNVIEAPDGKQGWQQVLSMHPDLVVSDISMPVMNGIELCKKIKSDTRTKHTPVILLTALAGEEKHLQGLEIGASDYMTKPFNSEILTSRIRNILNQQNILKKTLVRHVEAKPSDVKLESPDEKFMQQALVVIERNLSNPEFSVEDLSRELFISRVAMYKRIFTLTGKSPLDFIRSMRLKRAAQLLEKSDLTVAEIAYEVGFNNPKYFSRLFKAEYNLVPTAFQTEKKKKLKQVRI